MSSLSSNLRFLPHGIAGPIVLLALLGWAGWKSAAGTTGTLLYLGYGIAFMLAGRTNNFYWGAVVAPAIFVGLAFLLRGRERPVHPVSTLLPSAATALTLVEAYSAEEAEERAADNLRRASDRLRQGTFPYERRADIFNGEILRTQELIEKIKEANAM